MSPSVGFGHHLPQCQVRDFVLELLQYTNIDAWQVVSRPTFFILLLGFLVGFGSRYLSTIAAFVLLSHDDGALYKFEHGMLNLPIDCKSMWMNVGYWNVSRFMALLLLQHLSD
jgi:hypothetical protein